MSRLSKEVWSRLTNERVQGETLWARRAAPDITDRILAALDAEGQRHLLVPLESGDTDIKDTQSRGLGVVTRELVIPGHGAGRYLDITCFDAAGHDAFDLIGGELTERLAAERETASKIVVGVISKWRRFWGQLPRQMLSREEQCGLFAELWFLNSWMAPRFGEVEALLRWRGPTGARHDFEWVGRSVEVKATTSTRGHLHRINGLDQMAPPENGDLFLFSLQLREEAGAANSLPALVAVCRTRFERDTDILSRFEAILAQTGYSPAHEDEYAKLRLRIVKQGLFAVRGDFPRLTSTQFSGGVPAGVERVEYEINLGGFMYLCVARQPHEAAGL